MTNKDKNKVASTVDSEGFDYCFINYSTFPEIKDPEFHKLRLAYVEAHDKLVEYLGIDET